MFFNRNAVVTDFMRAMRNSRNRVAVGNVGWTLTQGSSCLATLGFGPESRWDSDWPRAGTLPLPGWFFLDKIFGGRKVKFVKRKKHTRVSHAKPTATRQTIPLGFGLAARRVRRDAAAAGVVFSRQKF